MQGPAGQLKASGFEPKSNGEAQKGLKLGNAMIGFMLHREQEWTQGSQIRDSPPRSCKNIAFSPQPQR